MNDYVTKIVVISDDYWGWKDYGEIKEIWK